MTQRETNDTIMIFEDERPDPLFVEEGEELFGLHERAGTIAMTDHGCYAAVITVV